MCVIPNALPKEFVGQLRPNVEKAFERKTVLMLSSLKEYKGTRQFIELAERLPQYKFVLVINDTQDNIDKYLNENKLLVLDNLVVYPRQDNVASFYNEASVVLNLSDKELCIETFGLTALEAMSCGLPVIVPPVGGIAEMVEDGVNGYKIDVRELGQIARCVDKILSNKELYYKLSGQALMYSHQYDSSVTIDRIANYLN